MPTPQLDEKAIFNIARKIDIPDARAEYLRQVCGENAPLLDRVDRLLRGLEQQGSFLEEPAAGLAATIDTVISEQPGTPIGPYKLLQKIGEGGMGVVYMAEQTEPLSRRVALKIIKPGMDTGQVIARFEAERQALAMMDHPNIARVLDAGATESGRPYFVMELVKGIPISEYCDEQHFTARERLELFVQVCQAVQHAHQKGVIHRDLKPSNVLVAEYDHEAVPKIIDFGVAKATSQKLTDKTMFTQYGQIVGTLEYMSPEQAKLNQLDIDTRSDVYSLGVLLYQLLTGTTPIDRERLRSAAFEDMLRIIREEEPPKPSTRISTLGKSAAALSSSRRTNPQKLRQLVHGELDWIVMKSLEKERARRYETAQGFADDVQRYLNDEAVQACPPSRAYQARKFFRRHRGPVVTGISLLALLTIGTMGTLTGWINAVKERREADNQRLGAIAARDSARAAKQREAEQGRVAVAQRRKAEEAQARETELRLAADDRRREAELQQYVSDISLAHRLLNEGKVVDVEELLRKHIPVSGARSDLRSFEWYFLWRLCQGDSLFSQTQRYQGRAIAVSPGNDWIATTSIDGYDSPHTLGSRRAAGQLTLYSLETPRTPVPLKRGLDPASCVAFSPDGLKLFAGNLNGSVDLWAGDSFQEMSRLEFSHRDVVTAIAFAPAGDVFATGSKDGRVVLWNSPDVEVKNSWPLGRGVLTLSFSCDGHTLAVGGGGGDFALINVAEPEGEPAIIKRRKSSIRSLAFSPVEAQILAISHQDGFVFLRNISTHEEALVGSHLSAVNSLAFLPDGKTLVSASVDSTIRLWDCKTRKQLGAPLKGHRDQVAQVVPSPDGSKLYSISLDKTLKAWSAAAPSEFETLPVTIGDELWVRGIAFSRDGKSIISGSADGVIRVWDVTSGRLVHEHQAFPEDQALPGFARHPHKDVVAVSNRVGEIQIWDVQTRQTKKTFQAHDGRVFRLEFSPDGKYLVSALGGWGSLPGEVKIWNCEAFDELKKFVEAEARFVAHEAELLSLTISPDSRILVTGANDGSVRLWQVESGAPSKPTVRISKIKDLLGHTWSLYGSAFSSDGRFLATGDPDSVILWNLETNTKVGQLPRARGEALAFTHDGRTLVTGGGSGTFKLWNVATQREMLTLVGHQGYQQDVAFSPDGTILATASADGTVGLWRSAAP